MFGVKTGKKFGLIKFSLCTWVTIPDWKVKGWHHCNVLIQAFKNLTKIPDSSVWIEKQYFLGDSLSSAFAPEWPFLTCSSSSMLWIEANVEPRFSHSSLAMIQVISLSGSARVKQDPLNQLKPSGQAGGNNKQILNSNVWLKRLNILSNLTSRLFSPHLLLQTLTAEVSSFLYSLSYFRLYYNLKLEV